MRTNRAIIATSLISAATFLSITLWIGSNAKSATENALASVFLVVVSTAASWIIAHYYYLAAKESEIDKITEFHNASLKTYALKAAEKVNNLSNELNRLSIYLKEYLQNDHEEDNIDVIISVRDERIYGAIHIVEMLRSVNDTSLSDWKGVIGDELDKQKEEAEEKEIEREARLAEIAAKVNMLLEQNSSGAGRLSSDAALYVKQIREELGELAAKISTPYIGRQHLFGGSSTQGDQRSYVPCPQCGKEIRINLSKRGKVPVRTYVCSGCKTRLVSGTTDDGDACLDFRAEKQEIASCPSCGEPHAVLLENVAGVSILRECNKCGERFRVNRATKTITVTGLGKAQSSEVDTDLIASVQMLLPQQPWPKGIADYIAEKLGVPKKRVGKVISHLINKGVFQHQVCGKLYSSLEEAQKAHAELQEIVAEGYDTSNDQEVSAIYE